MSRPTPNAPRISRRRFLRTAARAGLGALAASTMGRIPSLGDAHAYAARRRRSGYWSDPHTWGGRVPGRNSVAVVTKRIVLDVDAQVRGVIVKGRGRLVFHPNRSVTLRSTGNVVVRGALTLRPRRPVVVHRLVFPGIDERRFVGGGMEVIPSDVGLWVTGDGAIDIAGSSKLAWTRTAGAVPAGAIDITIQDDPVAWRIGDEIVLTPTLPPSDPNHSVAYDIVTVAAIDPATRRITMTSATKFAHPAVEVEPGVVLTSEVLNLTRNVRIEGTARGRSHIWMRSSRPQLIRHATLRYMGPRQPRADIPAFTKLVAGRYGLHFHEMRNAARGSEVTGVVVRDSGNHAFVTHRSHGVTFRDCISHDTFEDAYWWDPSPNEGKTPAPPTDDVLYQRCVASLVRFDPPSDGFRLTAFFLGARHGNVIRNCVAVGVLGSLDSSGFFWPESSGGLWKFEDCLAHNNRANGITVWQNNAQPHVINRFTGYHNGRVGILQGSYTNGFVYQDSVLFGNGSAAIDSKAVSVASPVHSFSGLRCDQAGMSAHCVVTTSHPVPPLASTWFTGCRFRGYRESAFGFIDQGSPFPNRVTVADCAFEGNEFWLGPDIHAASRIRVQDAVHGWITLRRADQPGEFRPQWNASVTSNIT